MTEELLESKIANMESGLAELRSVVEDILGRLVRTEQSAALAANMPRNGGEVSPIPDAIPIPMLDSDLGPFRIEGKKVKQNYVLVEQELVKADDFDLPVKADRAEKVLWAEVGFSGGSRALLIRTGEIEDYDLAVKNPRKSCTPIYLFDSRGEVEVDFRLVPHAQQWNDIDLAPESESSSEES